MRLFSAMREVAIAAALAVVVIAAAGFAPGGAVTPVGYQGSRPAATDAEHGDCERVRPGAVAQPANAWSAFAIVAVGLAVVAAFAARRAPHDPGRGPIRRSRVFAVAVAAAIVLAGAGSFAFHRSPGDWSGWLDSAGVAAIPLVWAGYDLAILRDWTAGRFATVVAAAGVVVGALLWLADGAGPPVTAVLVAGALSAELALARRRRAGRAGRRDPEWLFGLAATLAVAVPMFLVSRTGGPWCEPDALLQGHAVWHVLAAVAIAFGVAYLWSERAADART